MLSLTIIPPFPICLLSDSNFLFGFVFLVQYIASILCKETIFFVGGLLYNKYIFVYMYVSCFINHNWIQMLKFLSSYLIIMDESRKRSHNTYCASAHFK